MKEVMRLKSGVSAAAMFGVNTSINTSYASPKPAKPKTEKKKSLFAKKEVKPLVLNPNLSNLTGDFSMPSGSNLDINKGYLNKIKKQLEKREEKQAKKTLSTSLPLSSSQPKPANQTIQPLTLSQASGQTNPGSQTAGPRAPGPQTSGPRAPGPPSVREVAAMDRLKGLGLTVSVGQVTKDVSKPTTPAPRPKPLTPLTPRPQQPAPQRPQPPQPQRPQAQPSQRPQPLPRGAQHLPRGAQHLPRRAQPLPSPTPRSC